jgi:hypothetical protein
MVAVAVTISDLFTIIFQCKGVEAFVGMSQCWTLAAAFAKHQASKTETMEMNDG